MYIYHCFRSYDWEETLVFTVIGLYRPIYGPCIHQCIFFACTFVNLTESVKIYTGKLASNNYNVITVSKIIVLTLILRGWLICEYIRYVTNVRNEGSRHEIVQRKL